jgi:hypothetical protein
MGSTLRAQLITMTIQYIVVAWFGTKTVRLYRSNASDAFSTKSVLEDNGWTASLRRVVTKLVS